MSEDPQGTGAGAGDENAAEAITPDEARKLREQNQRLKGQLTDAEKKYNQFASIYKDVDPDEARALKAKLEEVERKAAEKDPAKMEELFERKLNKYRGEYEAEKGSLTRENEGLKKELKTLKVTDRVMSEIGHLFNKDALRFIKREVEELCDLDEDGAIVVKDEDGQPLFKGGKYLGIKDFGDILVERYPSLAAPQGAGGSRDVTPGARASKPGSGRDPQNFQELQAMGPAGKEWLARAKVESPEKVQKILGTIGR